MNESDLQKFETLRLRPLTRPRATPFTASRSWSTPNSGGLSAVQYQMRRIANFQEFATQSEFFVDVASDYKADFLLFPELFTTQLLSTIKADRPGQSARMLADFTKQYVTLFRDHPARR